MLLHHYTDSGGLLGIIESRKIRATNVWFMNDSVEATFGWGRIERFLDSKSPSSAKEKEVIRLAKAGLHGASNKTDFPDSYIACFSQKGNDLSQWRAYGRGRGFSIGFDSDELNRLARAIGGSDLFPPLRKVAYGDAEQEYIIETNYGQRVETQLANEPEVTTLAGLFDFMATMLLPSLKHPAFEAEAEWRLQFFLDKSDPKVKFRDSAMGVTPFIEMSLCDPESSIITCMREVTIGPQRHPDEAFRAVSQFLSRNGLEAVELKPSKIPLRPN